MLTVTNDDLAGRRHGIRLYRDEAALLNIEKSILLQDNNYAVILAVHHNLHCLASIHSLKNVSGK